MNIGMFPMSGIRVCDTELLRLGLTLPGFVERSKTIASLPSLGLLTLAGMTPTRHRIQYIEVPDEKLLTELPSNLDLAAISSYSAQIDEAYALAERFKAIGVLTVIGGPHVTALPEEAAQHCDAVVIGEGEPSWLQVLEDAERGTLQQFYRQDSDQYDLANAPMPAFEMLDISKYNRLTVQTSRGCPHHCEFCAGSVLLTEKYKQKPTAKVVAEIDKILTIWPHPFIEFADDNSFVNHAYWKELLPQLKERKIKWFTETDISVADDAELLDLMRESGCAQVLIGLESPVAEGLQGVELYNNWKLKKFPQYRQAICAIQSRGITVNGCFAIGLDGHTTDIFDQVFAFVKDSELYEVQITLLTPFPGTPLYARLEREGRLIEPHNWKKRTLFDLTFQPAEMSITELHNGFRKLAVDLYSQEITSARRQRYKRAMKELLSKKGA
ncbi:MAG: radical SAM protein [Kiritimatiellae bacterium]|nr:radical SAM protein [Kiritimatiellia bacterium]